jgi:hypothetical protein
MRRLAPLLIALAAGLLLGAVIAGFVRFGDLLGRGPDPQSVATATLQSVREQNRLTAFSARYVAVVTSTQNRFGLSARKTLIMPGTVAMKSTSPSSSSAISSGTPHPGNCASPCPRSKSPSRRSTSPRSRNMAARAC